MQMSQQDEYEARKRELAKELSADFQSARRDDSTNLTKSLAAAGSWVGGVKELLTDSVSLGRDLDRSNFARDPQISASLERAEKMLAGDDDASTAFVAELLEISLGNARESIHSLANSDSRLSPQARETAKVVSTLIKTINTRGYAFQSQTQQANRGRSIARETWKGIEPRAAFWDRPGAGSKNDGTVPSSLRKFAGMTPDQIRKHGADDVARIERECATSLEKIAGGTSDDRIDREGRRRVKFNGQEYVEVIR